MSDRLFDITLDEFSDTTRPDSPLWYQIGLSPSERQGGPMATRRYSSKENFIADLEGRVGYSEHAIEKFFAQQPDTGNRHETLFRHKLTAEDAAYLGWTADQDRS
jgi:hypothetical protein